ncbi:TPA: hypothetical protein ACH3X2_002019 [Trebouxia sp. C0005]
MAPELGMAPEVDQLVLDSSTWEVDSSSLEVRVDSTTWVAKVDSTTWVAKVGNST